MANFYCIYETLTSETALRVEHLKRASQKFNVRFIPLESINLNYNQLPNLQKGDFLYNVARGSKNLESLLINKYATTFYVKNPSFISPNTIRSAIILSKANISIPMTIFHATNEREKLREYVEGLNGFPIVVKASGGTLGVGTMISKDFSSLFSLIDFLCSMRVKFMLRKYIKPKEVARLIVIGNKVVASNEKFLATDDFRTSIKHTLPLRKEYNKEIQKLAIAATKTANYENSGVDIIIDENDRPYVLEVNMPHDFVTTTLATNINIADIMVDYLIKKSAR